MIALTLFCDTKPNSAAFGCGNWKRFLRQYKPLRSVHAQKRRWLVDEDVKQLMLLLYGALRAISALALTARLHFFNYIFIKIIVANINNRKI